MSDATTESKLKAKLMRTILKDWPAAVAFRHEDRIRSGVPDISVSANLFTSWWEAKYANPVIRSRGIQDLTMRRLERAGVGYYVVYYNRHDTKRTCIVESHVLHDIMDLQRWRTDCLWTEGFDHTFVLAFMRRIHDHRGPIRISGGASHA